MSRCLSSSKQNSFTLIELLVVVAIMGILMALLLPAIASSLREAKRTLATADCKQIALGVVAYNSDNGSLPFTGAFTQKTAIPDTTYNLLNGTTGKKKVYFRAKTTPHKSPWNQNYILALDTDGDGTIPAADNIDNIDLPGPAVIWTLIPGKSTTYARSWDN